MKDGEKITITHGDNQEITGTVMNTTSIGEILGELSKGNNVFYRLTFSFEYIIIIKIYKLSNSEYTK